MLDKMIAGVFTVCMLLSPLATTSVVGAEIRFVRPSVEVPVRRGQSTEYKIVRLVKDGDQVELLEKNDAWARVRLKEGAEGWMPERFLSTEAPPTKLIEMLRTENEELKQQNSEREQELNELKGLQDSTGSELADCIVQRDSIQELYQSLQEDTADVVAIKNKMDATVKEIDEVRAAFAAVQQQNNELKRKTALTWFLAGGGVLFLGWLIGLITCRSRKKRPSLL